MGRILELNIDKSNISKETILKHQKELKKVHEMIQERTGAGNEFMDWLTWPVDYDKAEVEAINNKVKAMKEAGVEKLLVIGIGGSYLGAQAAIDFIQGKMNKQNDIIFAGTNMSGTHIKQIEKALEGNKWGICVISKSGTTLEPALSFRHFKSLLEAKEGKDASKELIVAVTDGNKGALKTLADNEGYETYVVPDGIGGRFSGTTPVGTFPMAFAGINVEEVLKGTEQAMNDLKDFEDNKALEYALVRFLLNTKQGKFTELFVTYDFDLDLMAEWWKQLFGESEGKDRKGILPSSVSYSRDLHSLGQIIQDGPQNFFETTLWIKEDDAEVKVQSTEDNLDGLNYLEGKTFHEINEQAFDGVVRAHYEGAKAPQLIIELKDKSAYSMGYLWYFFFIAVSASSYLQGVNPFDQPGVELYKANMFKNLKGE